MTPRVAALPSAVERAEETLRLVEARSCQAVERARSELASLRSKLEIETRRDPHPPWEAMKRIALAALIHVALRTYGVH